MIKKTEMNDHKVSIFIYFHDGDYQTRAISLCRIAVSVGKLNLTHLWRTLWIKSTFLWPVDIDGDNF
jgi:hypothetical protein